MSEILCMLRVYIAILPFMQSVDIYYPALNFVSKERVDPVLAALLALFGQGADSLLYPYLQLSLIFISCILLFKLLRAELPRVILLSLCFVASLVFLFGFERYLLRIHWYPLLLVGALCCASLNARNLPLGLLLLLITISTWILSAGSLSVFGLFIAILFYARFSNKVTTNCPSVLPVLVLGFSIIPALLYLPAYAMPQYPGGARVTPVSAFLSYPRPLIGPFLEPFPLVYGAYMKHLHDAFLFVSPLLALLVFGAVFGFYEARKLARNFGNKESVSGQRSFLNLVFILSLSALLVFGELLLPQSFLASAPYPTLARVVPGLAILGIPLLLLPFGLLFFLCEGLTLLCGSKLWVLTGGVLLLSVLTSVLPAYSRISAPSSVLISAPGFVEHSPSGYIYQIYGDWVAKTKNQPRTFASLTRLKRELDFNLSISASILPEEAIKAVDGDVHTRWRTGRAQRGGESLTLIFDRRVSILRVVLSTQGTPADFPRGIMVEGGDAEETLQVLFRQTDWLGPLRWTEANFPYFGPQSEVIIDFPEEVEVSLLKFTQVGKDSTFDWSVSEVKLYRKP